MINIGEAGNEVERLALSVFRGMEDGSLGKQLEALCTEDFVWANSGLPTLRGRAEVQALMAAGGFRNQIPILATMTHFSADLLHIASKGNVVFTERVDHHWDSAGRDLMTPHIVGVVEVRDGRVCALRDFYDVACYQQQPTAVQAGWSLEQHRSRLTR